MAENTAIDTVQDDELVDEALDLTFCLVRFCVVTCRVGRS
jgi:hypothetical protein